MFNDIYYIPCNYTKREYDNAFHYYEIGVDLGVINNERFEIFTSKDYIYPINEQKALLKVRLLGVNKDKATVGLPRTELVSGRLVTYVPFQTLVKNPKITESNVNEKI